MSVVNRYFIGEPDWTVVTIPRRFVVTVDVYPSDHISSLMVLEDAVEGMKPAEVDILISANKVRIESTYKFEGELRWTIEEGMKCSN